MPKKRLKTIFDGDDMKVDLGSYGRIIEENVFAGNLEKVNLRLDGLEEQLHYLPKHNVSERFRLWSDFLKFETIDIEPGRFSSIPFSDLFVSTVEHCWSLLVQRGQTSTSIISYSYVIVQELQRGLIQLLSNLSRQCFYSDFDDQRKSSTTFSYKQYIQTHKESKCERLFNKYPVLWRVLGIACEQWLENTLALAQRIESDFTELPVLLETGSSDRHRGGATVAIITFPDSSKWVYKPRDLKCEYAFVEIQRRLNQLIPGSPFHCHTILVMKDYGWTEFIEYKPCPQKLLPKFYFNSGTVLGLLWLLGATDAHKGNVRAHGTRLALIDSETLLTPVHLKRTLDNQSGFEMNDSALRTGLLPQPSSNKPEAGRKVHDVSGLGASSKGVSFFEQPVWYEVNSDRMEFKMELLTREQSEHLPCKDPMVFEFRESVVAGFKKFLYLVMNEQNVWLKENGLFAMFSRSSVRYIHRPTLTYRAIFEKSLSPNFQKDGNMWASQLDLLAIACLDSQKGADLWALEACELNDLLELDVPYFKIGVDDTQLLSESDQILIDFAQSGLEAAKTRLKSLDEEHINFHTAMVNKCLLVTRSVI